MLKAVPMIRQFLTASHRPLTALGLCAALAACDPARPKAVDALPLDATNRTAALAETKDALDAMDSAPISGPSVASAQATPVFVGRGFAQVAGQPGATRNERRLMAMRAARLDALRDLTEQIHGIRISSESSLGDAVLRSDRLHATVQGTLRGARTVSIQPKGDDGYEVVLEIDPDTVAYVLRAVGAG